LRSFGDASQTAWSAPFHDPEFVIVLTVTNDREWLGVRNGVNQFVFNHQSKDCSKPLSLSWNRIILNMVFERDRFAMSSKPWYRLPE
jgi:phospholipase A1